MPSCKWLFLKNLGSKTLGQIQNLDPLTNIYKYIVPPFHGGNTGSNPVRVDLIVSSLK